MTVLPERLADSDHPWAVRGLALPDLVSTRGERGGRVLAASRPGTLAAVRLVLPLRTADPAERTDVRIATEALLAVLAGRCDVADWETVEGNDGFTLAAGCLDDDLPRVVTLARETLTDPGWLTREAATAAATRLRERARRASAANAVAVRRAFLAPFGPRLPLNTPAEPADFDRPVEPDRWAGYLVPAAASVVGARPAPEAAGLLLPLTAAAPAPAVAVPPAPTGRPEVDRDRVPGAPQSALRLGAVVPGRAHADYPCLQLASLLLGGYHGSLLAAELRERLGIAYSPRALLDPAGGAALFCVEADVTTGTEEQAVEAVRRCVAAVADGTAPARALPLLRQLFLGRLVMSCSGRPGLASLLAAIAAEGLPPDWLARSAERVLGAGAGEVAATFARHCDWPLLSGRISTG